jgi:hypothetical protein
MEKAFEVEVGRVEIKGVWYFTVRVTDAGELAIKGHFNSFEEAKKLAEAEAQRLGVLVKYLD